MNTKLHNTIMRRIYYAYVIRTATQPGVAQGFVMLAALIALTYFVSLGNVLHNMTNVGFSGIGRFLVNAVTNTEAWTLLLVGVLAMAALSLRFSLAPLKHKAPKLIRA